MSSFKKSSKALRFAVSFFFLLALLALLVSFLASPFKKRAIAYLSQRKYHKLAEKIMPIFWENFMTSRMAFVGDYIYAGTVLGIAVIDARNKTKPKFLKRIQLYGRISFLSTRDHLAFVTAATHGLYVLDIRRPAQPKIIGKLIRFQQNYIEDAALLNSLIYLSTNHGLMVVDIKDPSKPVVIYTVKAENLKRVFLDYPHLYATQSQMGLMVFDLSNKEKPQISAKLKLYRPIRNHPLPVDPPPRWLVKKDHYVYISNGLHGIAIVDVSEPKSPKLVRHFPTGAFSDYLTLYRGYLLVRLLPEKLLFLDISNPVNPRPVKTLPGMMILPSRRNPKLGIYQKTPYQFAIADLKRPLSPKVLGMYTQETGSRDILVRDHFVYLAKGTGGLQIYRETEDGAKLLSTFRTTGTATRLAVWYPYVFVVNGVGTGVDVIDVSQPTRPKLLSNFNDEQNTWGISLVANRLFLGVGKQGVTVYDVSKPAHPKFLMGRQNGLDLDQEIKVDYALKLKAYGSHLFMIGLMGKVGYLDLRKEKKKIRAVRGLEAHVFDIALRDRLAYLGTSEGILVADARALPSLKPIHLFRTGGLVLSLKLSGSRLFAADYNKGIFVFSLKNPKSLKLIRFFASSRKPTALDVSEEKAFVANGQGGLSVIDLAKGKLTGAF